LLVFSRTSLVKSHIIAFISVYLRAFIPHILCSTLRAEHSLVQSAPAL